MSSSVPVQFQALDVGKTAAFLRKLAETDERLIIKVYGHMIHVRYARKELEGIQVAIAVQDPHDTISRYAHGIPTAIRDMIKALGGWEVPLMFTLIGIVIDNVEAVPE